MSLRGSAQGRSRADIIAHAKDAATRYYGHGCTIITLSNEQTEAVSDGTWNEGRTTVVTGFEADWEARAEHRMVTQTYGHDYCTGCKKERPDL